MTADSDFSHSDDVRKFVPQLRKENMEANQPILDLLKQFSRLQTGGKTAIFK